MLKIVVSIIILALAVIALLPLAVRAGSYLKRKLGKELFKDEELD